MATEELANDRTARAAGDVARSVLGPAAGALAAGAAALGAMDAGSVLIQLFRDGFGPGASPEALLARVPVVLARLVGPVLLAAFGGALLVGLFQTRGYVGAPGAQGRLPERASPNAVLGIGAWLVLGALLLVVLREVVGLAHASSVAALGVGGRELGARVLRTLVIAACGAALVDHLLRVRARAARLGGDRRRGGPPAVSPELERLDTLLEGASLVLVDGELAVAIRDRGDGAFVTVRARGLAARALIETARRRGVRVRAGAATAFEARALGAPLTDAERASLGLARREATA